MYKRIYILILAVLAAYLNPVNAQKTPIDDKKELANLKQHISYLASDKLEGREAGTKAEEKASDYIVKQFKKIGLDPKGDDGYLSAFPFTDGVNHGKSTALVINDKSYKLKDEWYPLPYSLPQQTVKGMAVNVGYGIHAPQLNYDDYKDKKDLQGKIFIIEISSPDGIHPHSKYKDYSDIRQKIDTAIAHGAAAIIFINNDSTADNPKNDFSNKITPSKIPVVFAYAHLIPDLNGNPSVSITVDINKITRTGHNVLGFINNGAATTVVIGAHYDHLGWGGESSLYRGAPAIHHGADDNASGVAALIELARYLKSSPDNKSHNYLFIAFSGEEKGLLGSNYYAKNQKEFPSGSFMYMINMDMVGRLKPDEKTLEIGGVGSSPTWHALVDTIKRDGIKIKTSESGIGPSDHTSFYLQNVPVLFFFTGSHNDYHKPTDTEEKINYPGELSVLKIVISVIESLDSKPKIEFTKTKEQDTAETPRFKVTLGVIPDYAFEGEGMRIDGVSDGKPAAKAGLKAGDIVLQMNDLKVTDMTSYMKALGKFKKGDSVTLKVKRGKDLMDIKAQF